MLLRVTGVSLEDVLRITMDLRMAAFASIEVVEHVRLLMGCSNRPLASSCITCS